MQSAAIKIRNGCQRKRHGNSPAGEGGCGRLTGDSKQVENLLFSSSTGACSKRARWSLPAQRQSTCTLQAEDEGIRSQDRGTSLIIRDRRRYKLRGKQSVNSPKPRGTFHLKRFLSVPGWEGGG